MPDASRFWSLIRPCNRSCQSNTWRDYRTFEQLHSIYFHLIRATCRAFLSPVFERRVNDDRLRELITAASEFTARAGSPPSIPQLIIARQGPLAKSVRKNRVEVAAIALFLPLSSLAPSLRQMNLLATA